MVAYLISQFIDIKLFELFRKLFPDKLWIRNNLSTISSQLIDTTIVVVISLVIYPLINKYSSIQIVSFGTCINIILSQYFFKVLIAILDTPFVYFGVKNIKKLLNIS